MDCFMIYQKFKNYKFDEKAFVETGTWCGDGVINAYESGFDQIHSIELFEPLYNQNIERFKSYNNIHLYLGDSSLMLYDVIKNIDDKILFWLDGHYSGGGTAQSNLLEVFEFPLLLEIQQIANHRRNDHTILIDDLRCFPSIEKQKELGFKTKYSIDILKEQFLKINEDYKFYTIDGYVPNDILLVTINDLPNVA